MFMQLTMLRLFLACGHAEYFKEYGKLDSKKATNMPMEIPERVLAYCKQSNFTTSTGQLILGI